MGPGPEEDSCTNRFTKKVNQHCPHKPSRCQQDFEKPVNTLLLAQNASPGSRGSTGLSSLCTFQPGTAQRPPCGAGGRCRGARPNGGCRNRHFLLSGQVLP